MSRVRITVSPTIRLIKVDLPAPEGPRSTPVRAGCSCWTIWASPSPLTLLVTMTLVAAATDLSSRGIATGDSARSDFVSTTTGTAPLCQAIVRYLSVRRTLTSVAATTMKATSTLAASTCCLVAAPDRAVMDQVFGREVGEDARGKLAWPGALFELFLKAEIPAQRSEPGGELRQLESSG